MSYQRPEPDDLDRLLDSVHVRYLNEFDQRILAALARGYEVDEIAAGLRRGTSTGWRHVANITERVFDPLGIAPSHVRLARWVRRHPKCCTGPANEMIEDSRFFG